MNSPKAAIGFIGLGNIGKPIAACLATAGRSIHVYDTAGADGRAPEGAIVAASVADLASSAGIVFMCLPSFEICAAVVSQILAARRTAPVVVDTSTIGPSEAKELAGRLASSGGIYVDAPVSGGVHRAYQGQLTSMVAAARDVVDRVKPLITAYSSNVIVVGEQAGQAQAMKLVNNYASILAMLGASEAIAYGLSQGLDMASMLAVMNVSSGHSFATQTLFPKHIASGAFDSAAPARIVGKDLALFLAEARKASTAHRVGDEALALFKPFAQQHAEEDWLRIFEFMQDRGAKG